MWLIKNCMLIDGVSDDSIFDAVVAVEGEKIRFAGSAHQAEEWLRDTGSEAAEVLDARGRTVMPGLIDAHVHLTMGGAPDNFRNMIMETANYASIQGLARARQDLEAGFTTIRCCGEKGEVDVDIRQAIRDGIAIGPRILASGKALTITGGHGDMFPGGMEIDGIAEICDGVEEVRQATRKRIKKRVDNIKLMATGGGMSPGPATVAQLSEAEMRAAVEEAEKNGICTAAHCIGEQGCENAVNAGVRTIEHGTFLNERTMEKMARQGTFLMSTLAAFKTIMYGEEGGVPEEHLKKVEAFALAHYKNLKLALTAGVRVGCGTDTGTPFNYHGENAYELQCLVEQGGMTPMQAIQAATSVNAEALMQEDIGVLAPGKTADFLIVEGNPLEDIRLLQNRNAIKRIYRDGRLLIHRDVEK